MARKVDVVRSDLDHLIDEAAGRACPSKVHELSSDGEAFLLRARARAVNGERLSYAIITRVLEREFHLIVNPSTIGRYLRQGCSCER